MSTPSNRFWLLTQQKGRNELCTFYDCLHEGCLNGALLMHLSATFAGGWHLQIPLTQKQGFLTKNTNIPILGVKKCALPHQKVHYFKRLLLDIIIPTRVINKIQAGTAIPLMFSTHDEVSLPCKSFSPRIILMFIFLFF